MNRPMIFLAAVASAALAVTSACLAEARNDSRPFRADGLHFTLTDARHAGQFKLELSQPGRRHEMSSEFAPSALALAANALDRDGAIAPAIVRDAGRIDCTGSVRRRTGEGSCRFSSNPAFANLLAKAKVKAPDLEEAYAMTLVDVKTDLVMALAKSGYGPADPDDLIALAAVGVTPAYLADLAGRGYRPTSLGDLVAFKAVGVTPAYVDGLMKAGLSKLDGDTIVSMRALDINPDFVAGFARIGYRDIDPDQLVAMKALGVTPEMVQALERDRSALSIPQRQVAADLIRTGRR